MRDQELYRMHQAEARRVALLYQQFEFLMTRQESYEAVLLTTGFWKRLSFFFRPSLMKAEVDQLHAKHLQYAKQQMADARAKVEAQKKVPKILLPSTNEFHAA